MIIVSIIFRLVISIILIVVIVVLSLCLLALLFFQLGGFLAAFYLSNILACAITIVKNGSKVKSSAATPRLDRRVLRSSPFAVHA